MRKAKSIWAFGIAITITVILAIKTVLYDIQTNGNAVTSLSGIWSAFATIVLGGIAYWQNKRYKQLADEANDMAFMPELYIPTALMDTISSQKQGIFNKITANFSKTIPSMRFTIHLQAIRTPMINLKVDSFTCENKEYQYSEKTELTLSEKSSNIDVVFSVPQECCNPGKQGSVKLYYENIYGTKYCKSIEFTIGDEGNSFKELELKKAQRINA